MVTGATCHEVYHILRLDCNENGAPGTTLVNLARLAMALWTTDTLEFTLEGHPPFTLRHIPQDQMQRFHHVFDRHTPLVPTRWLRVGYGREKGMVVREVIAVQADLSRWKVELYSPHLDSSIVLTFTNRDDYDATVKAVTNHVSREGRVYSGSSQTASLLPFPLPSPSTSSQQTAMAPPSLTTTRTILETRKRKARIQQQPSSSSNEPTTSNKKARK